MGQKVNPIGLRLGINKTWKSRWFSTGKEFIENLHEDIRIRNLLKNMPETKNADVSDIEIIRYSQRVTVFLNTSRPGYLIGSKGTNIEKLQDTLSKLVGKKVAVKIKEVKKPEADAQIIAMNIARQIKARASFKKVVKQAVQGAIKAGAEGVKVKISGRLGGAELSRIMEVKERRVPLHTLRADIDYGFSEAFTTYGAIGVKVWVFKGEIFEKSTKDDAGQIVKKAGDRAEERV